MLKKNGRFEWIEVALISCLFLTKATSLKGGPGFDSLSQQLQVCSRSSALSTLNYCVVLPPWCCAVP